MSRSHAILFVTPEYNRSIPGGLKNAIDWASRPWGANSFARKPTAVIGSQMNSPEAYITFAPDLIDADGNVANPSTEAFLRKFMEEFHDFIVRVLAVLPHEEVERPT